MSDEKPNHTRVQQGNRPRYHKKKTKQIVIKVTSDGTRRIRNHRYRQQRRPSQNHHRRSKPFEAVAKTATVQNHVLDPIGTIYHPPCDSGDVVRTTVSLTPASMRRPHSFDATLKCRRWSWRRVNVHVDVVCVMPRGMRHPSDAPTNSP